METSTLRCYWRNIIMQVEYFLFQKVHNNSSMIHIIRLLITILVTIAIGWMLLHNWGISKIITYKYVVVVRKHDIWDPLVISIMRVLRKGHHRIVCRHVLTWIILCP